MSFPNRYKGNCHTCGTYVAAGAGIYDGATYCTDTIFYQVATEGTYRLCVPVYNERTNSNHADYDAAYDAESKRRNDAIANQQATILAALIGGELEDYAARANVKSLAQVIIKVTGADIAIADLTFEQATDVRNELQKRINRKAAAKRLEPFKASNTCNRCGGAGQADKWHHTGRICYQCGGTGKYYKN